MNSFSILVSAKKIILGEDVMIARNAVVFDSDFHVIKYDENQAEHSETVSIGDHVWIGANANILIPNTYFGSFFQINHCVFIRNDSSFSISFNSRAKII